MLVKNQKICQKSNFWSKSNVWSKSNFWSKSIFGKISKLWQTSNFWSHIGKLGKDRNFSQFLVRIEIFDQNGTFCKNSKFFSKIKISINIHSEKPRKKVDLENFLGFKISRYLPDIVYGNSDTLKLCSKCW